NAPERRWRAPQRAGGPGGGGGGKGGVLLGGGPGPPGARCWRSRPVGPRAPRPARPLWGGGPPGRGGVPPGRAPGRRGRGRAPEPLVDLGLPGPGGGLAPLALPAVVAVPGDGPARAVLFGADDGQPAIELIDVDRGRVAWRDRTACAAAVVGATSEVIVCADARGTRAVGLDGVPRW